MSSRLPEVRVHQISYVTVLVASIALLLAIVLPLWKPLFLATVLAALLSPFNEWLARKLGRRRKAASVITTFLLVVVVLVPIGILTVIGVTEAIGAIGFVRDALQRGGVQGLIHALPSGLEEPLQQVVTMAPASLPGEVGGRIAGLLSRAVAIAGGLSFALVMMLIAFYALLVHGNELFDWIKQKSPLPETGELLREARQVSVNVLRSAFVTAFAQGILATTGYLIAGVPNAIFFGVMTFFAAFIPSVGTSLVALPVIGLMVITGDTWQPIFLGAWFAVLVGFIDNLLNPMLIKGGMQVSGVVVFFSLIGGIAVFGAIGLIVGPVAVTFFLAMVRDNRPPLVTADGEIA
jgi:predicted PurR-regulated permease PerM